MSLQIAYVLHHHHEAAPLPVYDTTSCRQLSDQNICISSSAAVDMQQQVVPALPTSHIYSGHSTHLGPKASSQSLRSRSRPTQAGLACKRWLRKRSAAWCRERGWVPSAVACAACASGLWDGGGWAGLEASWKGSSTAASSWDASLQSIDENDGIWATKCSRIAASQATKQIRQEGHCVSRDAGAQTLRQGCACCRGHLVRCANHLMLCQSDEVNLRLSMQPGAPQVRAQTYEGLYACSMC